MAQLLAGMTRPLTNVLLSEREFFGTRRALASWQ